MRKEMDAGEFRLTLKAVSPDLDTQSPFSHEPDPEDNVKRIRGIASNTTIDLHDDIITEATIQSFKQAIEDGITDAAGNWTYIPLKNGHRNNWDDILGWVTKADVDENNNLWIEAELDDLSSTAQGLYQRLTTPAKQGRYVQLGFSIGGKITKYRTQWDAVLNKSLRILEALALTEISVVGQPANPTVYVEAITKSLANLADENDLRNSMADDNREKREVQETPVTGEDSVAIEIPTEQNVEDVDPATTARTDPSVNAPDVKPDVVSEPSDKSEDNVEEPNKNVEAEAVADPLTDIRETLKGLTAIVSDLTDKLNAVEKPEVVAEEVSKALEVPDTENSNPQLDMDALKALITQVVSDALSTVTDELTVIKSTVNEIANEPVDGSLSVRKAKEISEENPLETFRARISSPDYNKSSVLSDSVRTAMNVKR